MAKAKAKMEERPGGKKGDKALHEAAEAKKKGKGKTKKGGKK